MDLKLLKFIKAIKNFLDYPGQNISYWSIGIWICTRWYLFLLLIYCKKYLRIFLLKICITFNETGDNLSVNEYNNIISDQSSAHKKHFFYVEKPQTVLINRMTDRLFGSCFTRSPSNETKLLIWWKLNVMSATIWIRLNYW